MKSWIKRSLFGVVGASILLAGLTACGTRGESHRWQTSAEDSAKFRVKMVDRVSGKLDLNADQKQRLTVVADKLHAQRTALMGSSANPRADVTALVAGEKFDRTRAQALVTEKTAALNSQSPEVITALGDFYDSLNPAQQQKVRDFMNRGSRWGRHG
ncbi:Spy/CpxP family protein refolding chaperone [Ottowia thiooxydans]|uniref:Spy/CpxP family protein refolding chaperone n=1 Tax=Ottowia thiooxydans TaxID=219182 RepID=UPI00041A31ED|nr:Spy/CpxP family protein refolding chaperone [Ottowia thiooxydans]